MAYSCIDYGTSAYAQLQTSSTDYSIFKMRWLLIISSISYVISSASVSAQPMRQPSWDEVRKTAEGCSLVVHRVDIPANLRNVPTWAYYFDPRSTLGQRTCFYKRLDIGNVERIMREYDFTGAKQSGS